MCTHATERSAVMIVVVLISDASEFFLSEFFGQGNESGILIPN